MNYMWLKLLHNYFSDEVLYVKHNFWTELVSNSETHIVTKVWVSMFQIPVWVYSLLVIGQMDILLSSMNSCICFLLLFPKEVEVSNLIFFFSVEVANSTCCLKNMRKKKKYLQCFISMYSSCIIINAKDRLADISLWEKTKEKKNTQTKKKSRLQLFKKTF